MNKEQLEFRKKHNLTTNQFFGIEPVGGSLYLRGLTSIPEGFNPTVGGDLDLRGLTSIPEGFNPTVVGSLYLGRLTSIPEGFNPTVVGSLDLRGLTSIPEGFNPTVVGYLDLRGLTSIPEGFNPTVGGSLYLGGLTSIPEGFNPTVGGYLDLRGLTSIPEGFNPTVGGSLYLGGLTSIPEGFNPTVGGSLYLGRRSININSNISNLIEFKGTKYVSIDSIFCEIIYKRKGIFKVKKCAREKEFFIVTDGNNNYSHGDTIKEAKEDLIFKISNRSKDDYKELTTESTLTFEEAVKCYRVITGACQFGVKDFLQRKAINKKKFTIKEMITLTSGEYGSSSFYDFFNK